MKKKIVLISFVILALSLLSGGCRPVNTDRPVSKTALYYDTIVTVELFGQDTASLEELADDCMRLCDHYQKLFDPDIKTSDIARINAAETATVTVDHDTAVMLSQALHYSEVSDGKFDITIAPVSSLYDWHISPPVIPSDSDLAAACSLVDHGNVIVDTDKNTVTLLSGDTRIDPGAAAKGYIADRIADRLEGESITGAIINMGGDMRLVGRKTDNSLFNIGINDPDNDGCIISLCLSDCAVATSGTYERCYEKDGVNYHHILDPFTGKSADTDIRSITVISKMSLDCDCLCTVGILLGYEKASELIEQTPDTEAVFILNDGTVKKTSDADTFIRQ